MNQQILSERLNALKIEPPSPEAEDRAIRAGLEAFHRKRWHPSAWRLSLDSLRARFRMNWMVMGAVAASLCAVVVATTLLPRTDETAPDLIARTERPVPQQDIAAIERALTPAAEPATDQANERKPVSIAKPVPAKENQVQVALTAEHLEEVLRLYEGALQKESESSGDTVPAANRAGQHELPAALADSDSAGRNQVPAARFTERIVEVLRDYDAALRQKLGDERVDRLQQMAKTGELQTFLEEYLRKRQADRLPLAHQRPPGKQVPWGRTLAPMPADGSGQ